MKKIILIILICLSTKIFADGGHSYRFFVDVKMNDLYFSGYIYHHSYNEYDDKMLLSDYLKKELPNKKVKLYKQIKTLPLGNNYDFSDKDEVTSFNLTANIVIKNKEILKFYNTDRLKLVTKKEYDLIKNNLPKYVNLIPENVLFEENCSIIFFSWKNKRLIGKEVKKAINRLVFLSKKINKYKELNSKEFWQYYNNKKKELLEKEVIMLITYSML